MRRKTWDELAPPRHRPPRWQAGLKTAAAFAGGALLVGAFSAALTGLSAANRGNEAAPAVVQREVGALRNELDDVRGKLALAEARVEHLKAVGKYSALYGVPADLAGAIYDIALSEGIHPSL